MLRRGLEWRVLELLGCLLCLPGGPVPRDAFLRSNRRNPGARSDKGRYVP